MHAQYPDEPVDESTPLRSHHLQEMQNRRNDCNWTCYCVVSILGAGGITTAVIFLLQYLGKNHHTPPSPAGCTAEVSPLAYSYTVPYDKGGTLCVVNNAAQSATVNNLRFTTNANLEGSPWGPESGLSLFPWQSTITQIQNPNGLYSYVVHFPASQASVKIPSNAIACLNFNIASAMGPFSIAMDPKEVAVNDNILPIKGIQNCPDPAPGYRLTAWFPQWGIYPTTQNYTLDKMPLPPIVNEIAYAFGNVFPNGTISSSDTTADGRTLPALSSLVKQYNYLTSSIAFGGWGSAWDALYSVMSNMAARTAFYNNLITVFQMYPFRVINIDPEWWGNKTMTPNWELMADFFEGLDNTFKSNNLSVEVTWSAPSAIDVIDQIPNDILCRIAKVVSAKGGVQIMTYDMNGAFSQYSNYQSSIAIDPRDPNYANPIYGNYSIDGAVNAYKNTGCVSLSQMSIGAPAYGRSMYADGPTPWHTVTGTPPGQFDNTGTWSYNCIKQGMCYGGNQFPSNVTLLSTQDNPYGNVTREPWGFSETPAAGKYFVITYDDVTAVCDKAVLVKSQQLGGMMLFDASQQGSGNELLNTMQSCLKNNSTAVANDAQVRVTRSSPKNAVVVSSNNLSDMIDAVASYFPKELTDVLKEAALKGFLFAILSELTEPVLTHYLKKYNYTNQQIYLANQAVKALIILAQGAWMGSVASFVTSNGLKYLGCSERSSNTAGTVVAVATTVITTTATIGVTAAAVASGYAGAKAAQYIAKAGIFAFRKVNNYFIQSQDNIVESKSIPVCSNV